MYVAVVPNRKSPPAVLLRESYREAGRVKSRTLANLSGWAPERVEALRQALKGAPPAPGGAPGPLAEAFQITRSRPHGHVAAALGVARGIGLERIICAGQGRAGALALALVIARLVRPGSKLSTARGLAPQTLGTSLGEVLGVAGASADELYAAMDRLVARQDQIEQALAQEHLAEGALVLYDLTSAAIEGRRCPLARRGYARDGVRGRTQIEFGLLTTPEGLPVAVEVFAGNTADPASLPSQIAKLKERFGLARVVLVGDRGMITSARLREDLVPAGLDWVTALRAPQIAILAEDGPLRLSLFDEQDLAEIAHPDYPGERLVCCRNPLLAAERSRKREELLVATERELAQVAAACARERRPLRGADKIGLRVGRVIGRYKMAKHFAIEIGDESLAYRRDEERIRAEAALDGIYVLRTSLASEALAPAEVVGAYKRLAHVERAFRCIHGEDIQVRPVHHHLAQRVRAHVLICMLAYHLEWHLRRALAPILFHETDPAGAEARRHSPVAPAMRSASARAKAATKRTPQGEPVHGLKTLLADLATICLNRVEPTHGGPAFDLLTTPTPLQQRAFDLLGVSPRTGL
ncbi:MAG: IS1634 family transposase [Thermoleophilaceae bacterium]